MLQLSPVKLKNDAFASSQCFQSGFDVRSDFKRCLNFTASLSATTATR